MIMQPTRQGEIYYYFELRFVVIETICLTVPHYEILEIMAVNFVLPARPHREM